MIIKQASYYTMLACNASNQLRNDMTRNRRGSCHLTEIGTLAIQPLTLHK